MINKFQLLLYFIIVPISYADEVDTRCGVALERLECLERLHKEFTNENQEVFLRKFLQSQLNLSSCRENFNPAKTLVKWTAQGNMLGGSSDLLEFRKWEKKDDREPDVLNYMMEWKYPGFYLLTTTNFMMNGSSTWLNQFEVTDTNVILPYGLKIGMPFILFADKLDLNRNHIVPLGFFSEGGKIMFKVDSKGMAESISVKCIAD